MNRSDVCYYSCLFGILTIVVFQMVDGYVFEFGNCPIYYSEPCHNDLIQFTLVTVSGRFKLDPFKVKLPQNFDLKLPLKILIHGYGGLKTDVGIGNVSLAYENKGYNIIIVNWGPLSELPCYVTSYINTWHVGQCVAILAVSLIAFGLNPIKMHLIGFSLGAHVAGFASNNLEKALGLPFDRITGLDPALPFFATLKNDWKLDSSDAKFVDIIHTNAGSFGKIEPSGHVDFYINGGYMQPQCSNHPIPQLCSHFMAWKYFADTIKVYDKYYGFECTSLLDYVLGQCNFATSKKILMGEKCDIMSRGIYFVTTEENNLISMIFY